MSLDYIPETTKTPKEAALMFYTVVSDALDKFYVESFSEGLELLKKELKDIPHSRSEDDLRALIAESMIGHKESGPREEVLAYFEQIITRFPTLIPLIEGGLDSIECKTPSDVPYIQDHRSDKLGPFTSVSFFSIDNPDQAIYIFEIPPSIGKFQIVIALLCSITAMYSMIAESRHFVEHITQSKCSKEEALEWLTERVQSKYLTFLE